MDDSVLMYRDYGEIVFDLKSIMDKKGYTINYVVKRTGLHHQIVRRYYEGTALRYDKEILALAEKYNENKFYLSSRPTEEFIGWNDFCEVEALKLSKEQALSLIKKIE